MRVEGGRLRVEGGRLRVEGGGEGEEGVSAAWWEGNAMATG